MEAPEDAQATQVVGVEISGHGASISGFKSSLSGCMEGSGLRTTQHLEVPGEQLGLEPITESHLAVSLL